METITATPEAPAAPSTPAPTPEAPAINLESVNDRLSLSRDQRRGALFGQKPAEAAPVVATTPVTPEPAPVVEPAEVTIPAEVPPVEPPATPQPPAEVTPEAERILPQRINTKQFDAREQEAIALKHDMAKAGESISLLEACERVDAKYGIKKEIPGIQPAPPQPPAEIVAARAEVAALREKLAQAKKDAADGILLSADVLQLTEDYADRRADLGAIELRHAMNAERQAREQSQASQQNAHATRQSEMAATEAEFPALLDPDSDLTLELDRQFGLIASNSQHPDFQKVNRPGFPAYLTQQAAAAVVARAMKKNPGMTEAQALAAVKGSKPAEAPRSPAAAPAKPAAQPVPRTVLVTSPGGQQAPAPVQLSIEQIRAEAAKDPAFRRRALGFSDTRMVG